MTTAFIIRPFGAKPVTVKDNEGKARAITVDFERIGRELIEAASERNGLAAVTTSAIASAGNIRLDMFQMLISYDLVIADISIDNANVFYELGVRHGLRPGGTILIRFANSGREVPFDLRTDRYVEYDRDDPGAAVDRLEISIRETIRAMNRPVRERRPDSPVFLLLPDLTAADPAKLQVVPREFQEAVEMAALAKATGRATLALLGEEARRTPWAREAVRLVARAQRRGRQFESARESWQFILKDLPDDLETNLQLATVYQRLGDLARSSQACDHVLKNEIASRKERADARSQLARNTKASWLEAFAPLSAPQERRQSALSDSRLVSALAGYREGFNEDLNDYYSGINALGLLTAIVALAGEEPASWSATFDSEKKAAAMLEDYRERLPLLRSAVRQALDAAQWQADRAGTPDEWLPASQAQYALLTSDRPGHVKALYQTAKNASGSFSVESEAAQVSIFHRLGLFPENCAAAFAALGMTPAEVESRAGPTVGPRDRILLVTGHRADATGRATPRFPNTKECIAKARAWLLETVRREKERTTGAISGIGGAASGTDLLFHEVCEELGIPVTVVLPIPRESYRRESVADGGGDWVDLFNRRVATSSTIELSDSDALPVWAESIPGYSVFQRGNTWVMKEALLRPNSDTTLVAIWNQQPGEPGGTADMVQLAKRHGLATCIATPDALFGGCK